VKDDSGESEGLAEHAAPLVNHAVVPMIVSETGSASERRARRTGSRMIRELAYATEDPLWGARQSGGQLDWWSCTCHTSSYPQGSFDESCHDHPRRSCPPAQCLGRSRGGGRLQRKR
jgi:hypothetical protein